LADVAIDIDRVSPEERIAQVRELTTGRYGADVVFEAAGVPAAFLEGLAMVRPLGTFVELGLMVPTEKTVPLNVRRDITSKDMLPHPGSPHRAQPLGRSLPPTGAPADRYD